MIEFAKKFKDKGRHSQNGEMGIVRECIKRIKPKLKIAIEFGASDGFYCSNTAELPIGWKRHLYDDVASTNPKVEIKQITPQNVNDLPECSLLSIDIDGNDYQVWKAYSGKPAIVIIEINSDLPPTAYVYDKGTSYAPMVELGKSKGYFLLCHVGNLVFVDEQYKNLFPEVTADPIEKAEVFFDTSWLK